MQHEALQSVGYLIENCELLKTILPEAANYAAARGHEDLSDWHCFPVLITTYKDHPATKAALSGKSIEEFENMIDQLIKKYKPIKSISELTPFVYRLIYAMYSDSESVLKTRQIEPFHFYLAFLSRPTNVVYSLYEYLKIDVVKTIKTIINTTHIRYLEKVFYYYIQLHDTCLVMEQEPIRRFRSNSDKIDFIEDFFPAKLPQNATVDSVEYTSRLGYKLSAKLKVPDFESDRLIKDLEPYLKNDLQNNADVNTIYISLPNEKGSGKVIFDHQNETIYIECSSCP